MNWSYHPPIWVLNIAQLSCRGRCITFGQIIELADHVRHIWGHLIFNRSHTNPQSLRFPRLYVLEHGACYNSTYEPFSPRLLQDRNFDPSKNQGVARPATALHKRPRTAEDYLGFKPVMCRYTHGGEEITEHLSVYFSVYLSFYSRVDLQ